VAIFPSEDYIRLKGVPQYLMLKPLLNALPVDSQKYTVEWYVGAPGAKPVSTEHILREKPFLAAVGNKAGTYTVYLVVKDEITKKQVGNIAQATVTVKGEEEFIPAGHWVSATPGKGMRMWDASVGTRDLWWEGDVDLIACPNGSLTFTITRFNPDIMESAPKELLNSIGQQVIFDIENWRDDGIFIDFTAKGSEGKKGVQIFTFDLTRTPDGHLIGIVHAPKTLIDTSKMERPPDLDPAIPWPETEAEVWVTAREGTLDLVHTY
jgi:hypothetical protein